MKKVGKSSWRHGKPEEPIMLKFEIATTIRRMMKRVSDSGMLCGRGERDEEKWETVFEGLE